MRKRYDEFNNSIKNQEAIKAAYTQIFEDDLCTVLKSEYKEMSDELCTIPMAETSTASSFNVSCAASIMMYEVVRQRRG